MNELNVIYLPDFGMAKDEDEWILLIQKSLEEKGIKTNIDFLKILWEFAQKTVDRMGDIFWDPDVSEPCAYCHKNNRQEKCEYLAGRYPVKDAVCVWYGVTASERMMSYAAKTVLESLIAVVYYNPKEELVEFCRSINCFYRDWIDWFIQKGEINRANMMQKACVLCFAKKYNDWQRRSENVD